MHLSNRKCEQNACLFISSLSFSPRLFFFMMKTNCIRWKHVGNFRALLYATLGSHMHIGWPTQCLYLFLRVVWKNWWTHCIGTRKFFVWSLWSHWSRNCYLFCRLHVIGSMPIQGNINRDSANLFDLLKDQIDWGKKNRLLFLFASILLHEQQRI